MDQRENEAPVFSETTGGTLEIKENADDPEKEPPSTPPGIEYLLNRGVGKPSANLPAAPNLDVLEYRWLLLTTTAQVISPVGGYADRDHQLSIG